MFQEIKLKLENITQMTFLKWNLWENETIKYLQCFLGIKDQFMFYYDEFFLMFYERKCETIFLKKGKKTCHVVAIRLCKQFPKLFYAFSGNLKAKLNYTNVRNNQGRKILYFFANT